jgi:ElaB/YqjD/DUF883 family membrane-anchored ribosome-binding protein
MSNQDSESDISSTPPKKEAQSIKGMANEALPKASDAARNAGAKIKQTASDTASTVADQVKTLLDRQIGSGVHVAGQFASSAKLAADDLNPQSPFLAGIVRSFADRIEGYSKDLHDQTLDQVIRTASDFTRRQPTLVFSLAAVAGFLLYRTMKTAQRDVSSPSIQPQDYGQYHG